VSRERRPALVLVGPPGAGKTTVGRVLARRLDLEFVDVDAVIVARIGKSIADMFVQDGEDAFRALERDVVAESLLGTEGVLALGGGSVLAAQTRERLRGHRVVHLTVDVTDGLRRTGMSKARPLLAGVNPRATFRALLDARAPLYAEVATFEVDTVRRSAHQVARTVLELIGAVAPGAAADPLDPGDPLDVAPAPDPREWAALPHPTIGRTP
jgi:shikimate kinase